MRSCPLALVCTISLPPAPPPQPHSKCSAPHCRMCALSRWLDGVRATIRPVLVLGCPLLLVYLPLWPVPRERRQQRGQNVARLAQIRLADVSPDGVGPSALRDLDARQRLAAGLF